MIWTIELDEYGRRLEIHACYGTGNWPLYPPGCQMSKLKRARNNYCLRFFSGGLTGLTSQRLQ